MRESFYIQSRLFVKEAIDRGIDEELVVKVLVEHGWSPQAARALYFECKEEARVEEELRRRREERMKMLMRIKRRIEERMKQRAGWEEIYK